MFDSFSLSRMPSLVFVYNNLLPLFHILHNFGNHGPPSIFFIALMMSSHHPSSHKFQPLANVVLSWSSFWPFSSSCHHSSYDQVPQILCLHCVAKEVHSSHFSPVISCILSPTISNTSSFVRLLIMESSSSCSTATFPISPTMPMLNSNYPPRIILLTRHMF